MLSVFSSSSSSSSSLSPPPLPSSSPLLLPPPPLPPPPPPPPPPSSSPSPSPQGLLLAYSISNSVRTLLSLHQHMRQPMTKSGVLAVCRLVELLKCIQCTFHRRSMIVAEYITLIINHYELALLHQLNHTWVRWR